MKRGQLETVIFILIGLIAAGGALYAAKGPSVMPKIAPGRAIEQPLLCTGLEMVWTTGRRDPYQYAGDACPGFRCLKGNEISPACYNAQECPAACDGTCVRIPTMQQQCPPICTDSDGGRNLGIKGKTCAKGSCEEDRCSDDATQVLENYCELSQDRTGIFYPCLNGCMNGACVVSDIFVIEDLPTNPLNLNEVLGNVVETVVDDMWLFLKDGVIGGTKFHQYLRFNTQPNNEFGNVNPKSGSVIFAWDENNQQGNFLFFKDGDVMFEFEIEFEEGFDSAIVNNHLVDLEGKTIPIFKLAYTITAATIDSSTGNIKMQLDGPQQIVLVDSNFADTAFALVSAEVNNELIEDAEVRIHGALLSPTSFELSSIRYRLRADLVLGDGYVPIGGGLRQQLDEPQGLLGNWDIFFDGVNNNIAKVYLGPAKQPPLACIDSDGGMDIFTAGQANTPGGGMIDNCDFLTNVNGIMNEAVCDADGNPAFKPTKCPESAPYCRDGVCTTDNSPACKDTDGENVFTRGTISERRYVDGPKHTDYCQNMQTLQPSDPCEGPSCGVREFTCQVPYVTTTYNNVQCPNGCMNGACVQDLIKIAGVAEAKDSYSPGEGIKLQIKAVELDGLPAENSEGYNIQFYTYDATTISSTALREGAGIPGGWISIDVVGDYNAIYNAGYWYAKFKAPTTPGIYYTLFNLYCSKENTKCWNDPALKEAYSKYLIKFEVKQQGEFNWQIISKIYYDRSTFVENPLGIQAKYIGTCEKVCADSGLDAQPKCIGWGPNYCRKTGTPDELMSASPSCEETGLTGIIGLDYCCCGPAATCKCGVNTFKLETPCDGTNFESGARFALWKCHDGAGTQVGSANVCKSSAEWQSEAKQWCEGRCTSGCPAISSMWLKTDKSEYMATDQIKVYTHLPNYMNCRHYFVPATGEPQLRSIGGCGPDGVSYSGPVPNPGEWRAQIVAWYPESPQDTYVVTSPPFKVLSAACTDTDGGVNYDSRGTVTYPDGGKNSDLCIDENGMTVSSGPTVVEYSCPLGKDVFKCPSGCKDGECRKPAAKNCGELFRNPTTAVYFPQCKNAGYENVCFNKYSGEYQGCTKDSWNDCTQNNVNSASNLLCRASTPGGCEVFYDETIGAEKKDLDFFVPDCARMAGGTLNCQSCDTRTVSGRKKHYTREIVNKPKCGTFTPRPSAQAIECPSRKVCKYTTIEGKKVGYCG